MVVQPSRGSRGHDLGDGYLAQLDSMERAPKAVAEMRAKRPVRDCPVRDCGRPMRLGVCQVHGEPAEDSGQWLRARLAAKQADT